MSVPTARPSSPEQLRPDDDDERGSGCRPAGAEVIVPQSGRTDPGPRARRDEQPGAGREQRPLPRRRPSQVADAERAGQTEGDGAGEGPHDQRGCPPLRGQGESQSDAAWETEGDRRRNPDPGGEYRGGEEQEGGGAAMADQVQRDDGR